MKHRWFLVLACGWILWQGNSSPDPSPLFKQGKQPVGASESLSECESTISGSLESLAAIAEVVGKVK